MKKTFQCPTCNKSISMDSSNRYRPFCSERCRMIDLGEWMEEGYTISDKSSANHAAFDTDTGETKIRH